MSKHKELDERKKLILKAIIDDYIVTAEPIGSRTIAKKGALGISSATIRNEMADLEEMGYLEQPHTSAGRVPSVKGYRLYVDSLMDITSLTKDELEFIKEHLEGRIDKLADLIKQASSVISEITHYTTVATAPKISKSKIKNVQLLYMDPKRILMILVTNEGMVKHSTIHLKGIANPEDIERVSKILNKKLSGLTVEMLNIQLIQEIQGEFGVSKEFLLSVMVDIAKTIQHENSENSEIFLNGTSNIFKYQEFTDSDKAKAFFDFMQRNELINRIMLPQNEKGMIDVKIGSEIKIDEVSEFSIVTTSYSLGDYMVGTIGVIGPKRMEYPKVISAMDYITKELNKELEKMFGEEKSHNG
jgi:heat-inducible transcriptional repressor